MKKFVYELHRGEMARFGQVGWVFIDAMYLCDTRAIIYTYFLGVSFRQRIVWPSDEYVEYIVPDDDDPSV